MNSKKLEKLKNAKKRKKRIRLLTLVLVVFCVFYIKTIPREKNRAAEIEESILVENEKETEITQSLKDAEIGNEVIEEVVEEEQETYKEQVEKIVEKYINAENLDENNFAFFYYNPKTEEYYVYNEDTFFTAASTIKVPLAMLYYDKINNGDLTLDSTLQYKSWEYEAGNGSTAVDYDAGQEIPIAFLLQEMIVNSDNTATNILKDGLGGEKAYRILIKQYTKRNLPNEFNEENVTSAGYSFDVLKRLYENQDKYKELIEYMKISSNGGYLKKDIENYEIAHKYGSYNGNVHDYGICYTENEYLIGIFTKEINGAEDLISDINKEIILVR